MTDYIFSFSKISIWLLVSPYCTSSSAHYIAVTGYEVRCQKHHSAAAPALPVTNYPGLPCIHQIDREGRRIQRDDGAKHIADSINVHLPTSERERELAKATGCVRNSYMLYYVGVWFSPWLSYTHQSPSGALSAVLGTPE
jgi:hypothetical protein